MKKLDSDLDTDLAKANDALKSGNPSEAFNLFASLLIDHPDDEEIRYGAALSAARVGSISAASGILHFLVDSPCENSPVYLDALSLLGRIEKDRYSRLIHSDQKKIAAIESARFYARAYESSHDYYPGLNAATMYALAGESEPAYALVSAIVADNKTVIEQGTSNDPWLAATLGEIFLLQNNQLEALHWYSLARKLMGDSYGDISSMRRQLYLLKEVLSVEQSIFDALDIPSVVTMTGNMVDSPQRDEPRFPQHIENQVRHEVDKLLEKINAGFGYCSAACGADIIFIEAMLARGAEVHVNLPFEEKDFLNTSVCFAGEDWGDRYHAALERCTSVNFSTIEGYLGDDTLFEYNADVITGKTMVRARQLSVEPQFIAIYDLDSETIIGGAKATSISWKDLGYQVSDIDLGKIRQKNKLKTREIVNVVAPDFFGEDRLRRKIRTMMFADIVGFSKLAESQTPQFFIGLLNEVSELMEADSQGMEFCNTWGDALFMVFDDLQSAAKFSVNLRDLLSRTNWEEAGLPGDTSIRIAMHVGPVYEAFDPIIKSRNYFGSHVNRAARMEPITTPGSVFVSEQTAALLAMSKNRNYHCDFLGMINLAKGFGEHPMYRLRRSDEVE